MTLKKNKKGFELYSEVTVAAVSIILIVIIVFFLSNYSSDSKKQFYEMAPELSYQYPAVFTHSFLMTPLNKEEKTKLSLDPNTNYFVKDLIILATDESKEIYENKRDDFVEEYFEETDNLKSSIELYETFSNHEKIQKNDLLCYDTNPSQNKDLENEIYSKNYFFYVKNMQNEYSFVRFYCG